jgi:lambda repressor-like predicted transcriptional regulator
VEITKEVIRSRMQRRGLTVRTIAAQCGYSPSSVNKVTLGYGSAACTQAVAEALGLAKPADADNRQDDQPVDVAPAVEVNGRADDAPVVDTGFIVDGMSEITLPGALVLMARNRKLPFDQVVTLARLHEVLVDANPKREFDKQDWNDFCLAVEPWL